MAAVQWTLEQIKLSFLDCMLANDITSNTFSRFVFILSHTFDHYTAQSSSAHVLYTRQDNISESIPKKIEYGKHTKNEIVNEATDTRIILTNVYVTSDSCSDKL